MKTSIIITSLILPCIFLLRANDWPSAFRSRVLRPILQRISIMARASKPAQPWKCPGTRYAVASTSSNWALASCAENASAITPRTAAIILSPVAWCDTNATDRSAPLSRCPSCLHRSAPLSRCPSCLHRRCFMNSQINVKAAIGWSSITSVRASSTSSAAAVKP